MPSIGKGNEFRAILPLEVRIYLVICVRYIAESHPRWGLIETKGQDLTADKPHRAIQDADASATRGRRFGLSANPDSPGRG